MEVFNGPVVGRTQLFSRISLFRPNPLFANHFKKNPSRAVGILPSFLIKTPFSSSSIFSNGRSVQISAQLRRVSKRRNSLRKKLSEKHQVRRNPESVSPGSDSQNPVYASDEIEPFALKMNSRNLDESGEGTLEKSKLVGNSVLWNKLESWVDQYKKEVEFWGIGSGPIFTVFQDSKGNVERVSVNEDEILRRSQIEPWSFRQEQLGEDFMTVNSKISYANALARQMETGEYKPPKNSAVTKYVVSVKRILVGGNDKVELTGEEKELLMRKMKSRMEKEKTERGSVEVLPVVSNSLMRSSERPQLDTKELVKSLSKAKTSREELKSLGLSIATSAKSRDFNNKIQEIKKMARQARELERQNEQELDDGYMNDKLAEEKKDLGMHRMLGSHSLKSIPDERKVQLMGTDATTDTPLTDKSQAQAVETRSFPEGSAVHAFESSNLQTSIVNTSVEVSDNVSSTGKDSNRIESQFYETPNDESYVSNEYHFNTKPFVIRSVKEAREYLSRKHYKMELDQDPKVSHPGAVADVLDSAVNEDLNGKENKMLNTEDEMYDPSMYNETSDAKSAINAGEDTTRMTAGLERDVSQSVPFSTSELKEQEQKYSLNDLQSRKASQGSEETDHSAEHVTEESWLVNNFQDFEPIAKKIGDGFRENYMVAKEKAQDSKLPSEVKRPEIDIDEDEFEWMKNDRLREIVFQVRENELMGQDPFHMMDAEDKSAFFKGLERKVEEENSKLLNLHEWVHSKVENLHYGVDGISLYDPPEKVIPRWKGPPVEGDPEVLNNVMEQRKAIFAENAGMLPLVQDAQNTLHKSVESPASSDISNSLAAHNLTKMQQKVPSKNPKTVIECSDGSSRTGKKSGKEYWQHTKKWSWEFLEAYNAEIDPEIKSIMKNMGKDLDRWITEKEVQEAADLLTKVPRRKRRYIEKKLDKLKREMEMFGPQAVVSKYREYAEDDGQDYLWWLDLPFVLCIEMYTIEDGVQKVGFYSLEMAADLELDPKQYHVIAFEDSVDSKNLCYIIQAHMEMLGNGSAFIVARPPKDAFREAKANGFSVTVIRKGELQLNIDQTLEEVEEQITEIGSKIYHDKIMRERSVDMGSLMKGVFATNKPAKRT